MYQIYYYTKLLIFFAAKCTQDFMIMAKYNAFQAGNQV